jgi:hypothetical protein
MLVEAIKEKCLFADDILRNILLVIASIISIPRDRRL